MTLKWSQVLAWRMRRQELARPGTLGAVDLARRLGGLQAQVASAAELAVAVRRARPALGLVAAGLADGSLVKTWAMRGTLHALPAADAGAFLSLVGTHEAWLRPSWQKAFGLTPTDIDAMTDVAREVLAGRRLSRAELVDALVTGTRSPHLAESLRSGWGSLLKPLALRGALCHGPGAAGRVTFTLPSTASAGWGGLPEPDEAVRTVLPTYLGAYGPASPEVFRLWLNGNGTRMPRVRGWFAELASELSTVDVEGEKLYARAEDVDALYAQRPSRTVRLVPGFDQSILGPGTLATAVVPAQRRAEVSRTAGWISPVVLVGGRAAGVWGLKDSTVDIRTWEPVPAKDLAREVDRLAAAYGRRLTAKVG